MNLIVYFYSIHGRPFTCPPERENEMDGDGGVGGAAVVFKPDLHIEPPSQIQMLRPDVAAVRFL